MSYRKECESLSCWVKYLSTISIWSNVCSSYKISLFFFSVDYLSVDDSGVFRSPTITVLLSMCALRAITVFFYVGGAPVLGSHMLRTDISS
jgi:hypothetical protein